MWDTKLFSCIIVDAIWQIKWEFLFQFRGRQNVFSYSPLLPAVKLLALESSIFFVVFLGHVCLRSKWHAVNCLLNKFWTSRKIWGFLAIPIESIFSLHVLRHFSVCSWFLLVCGMNLGTLQSWYHHFLFRPFLTAKNFSVSDISSEGHEEAKKVICYLEILAIGYRFK